VHAAIYSSERAQAWQLIQLSNSCMLFHRICLVPAAHIALNRY
uniref:Uncharacterized protein n=1 Tax=Aegilops tauschii subsp. strangulata TaxID=200361 RepID=A0A453TCV0_AEGTS